MFGKLLFGAARRAKSSHKPANGKLAYNRAIRMEALEDRRMLSIGSYPEIPGMVLVDPVENQFEGQVVYLDFDGAENVTYNGPVAVEGIDVPAFEAPGELAGQEQQVIAEVVSQLEETFAGTGIVFTTEQPAAGVEYSTIYVGGDDSAFREYGSFFGLAEQVDEGNGDRTDEAFVFSDSNPNSAASAVPHELGHLLGYCHSEDRVIRRAPDFGDIALTQVLVDDDVYTASDLYISDHEICEYTFYATAGDVIGIDVRSPGNDVDLALVVRTGDSGSGRIADTPGDSYDDTSDFLSYKEDLTWNHDNLFGRSIQAMDPGPLLFYAPTTTAYRVTIQVDPDASDRLSGGYFDVEIRRDRFSGPSPRTVFLDIADTGYGDSQYLDNYLYDYAWEDGTSWVYHPTACEYMPRAFWWEDLDDDAIDRYDEVFGSNASSGKEIEDIHRELRQVLLYGTDDDSVYGVVDWLQDIFKAYNATFVSEQPNGDNYIHVNMNTTIPSFASGCAQVLGPANRGHSEVIVDRLSDEQDSALSFAQIIHKMAGTIAHEIGHTMGLRHASNITSDNIMAAVDRVEFSDSARYCALSPTVWGGEGIWGVQKADSILKTILGEAHTITAFSGLNGDIVDADGHAITSVEVPDGESYTFYAAPNEGYLVGKWYVDGDHWPSYDGQPSLTRQVIADGFVYVTFKPQINQDITILSPGSEVYPFGSQVHVAWTATDVTGNAKIELYKGGSFVRELEDSVAVSDGSDSVTLPYEGSISQGTDYRIKVTSLDDSSVYDYSSNFEIRAIEDPGTPIEINSIADLRMIGSGVLREGREYSHSADYVLVTDLDFTSSDDAFEPLCQSTAFRGSFDGQGHIINDLRIEKSGRSSVGLFSLGHGNAVIKNLTLTECDVVGHEFVGALAGQWDGTMLNCHANGDVSDSVGGAGNVGGLVGHNDGTILNSSYRYMGSSNADVEGYGNEIGGIAGNNGTAGVIKWCWVFDAEVERNVNTVDAVGGIVGENRGLIQECCFSTASLGEVYGDDIVGGIAGYNGAEGIILDCYAIGQFHGDNATGGIVGETFSGSRIERTFAVPRGILPDAGLAGRHYGSMTDSFWNSQTTGLTNAVNVGTGTVTNCVGLNTAAMQQQITFASVGWDFENVWEIDEGTGYPELRGAKPSLSSGPSSVTATEGVPGKVTVSWIPVTGADAYGIYRATSEGIVPVLVDYGAGTSFDDTTTSPGTTYYYYVTAAYTNSGAGESELNLAISDTGYSVFQPEPPVGVSASTHLKDIVLVQWDPASGASYYRVSRSTTGTGAKTLLSGWINDYSYSDSSTTMGTEYYYWVQAATSATGTAASDYSSYAMGREGEPDIRVSENSWDFGRKTVGLSSTHNFTVFNDGSIGLVVDQAGGLSDGFVVLPANDDGDSTDDWTVASGDSKSFTVVFTPASGGPASGSLVLHSNDPDTPDSTISLAGVGNDRPTASIDLVTPNPAQPPNDSVRFEGSASDSDGSIAAYEWRSNLDGSLSLSEDFEISSNELTAGEHMISFRVTDNDGAVSEWAATTLVVESYVSQIIDDEDPGHQFVGGWGQAASTICYGDDFWYNVAGSGADKSVWTFSDLPEGNYEILATWPAHRNRATNAPYTLDGGGQPRTVLVNQTQAPNDVTSDGSRWEILSAMAVSSSGTLTVTLSDAGDGYAVADAIWVREIEVSQIIDDEDPGHQFVGGWGQGGSTACYGGDFWYNAAGSGADQSIWTFTGLPTGNYEILATWPAHRNRATNAPYTLDGGSQTTTVLVNQTQVPNDVTSDGVRWEILSAIAVSNLGTLTVTLTDAGDGYAMADAIWVREIDPVSRIIDDEDPGHQFVGGWGQGSSTLCYGDDFWYNAAGSGADQSVWTFAGLPQGNYEVLATWPAHRNRATNAPYTLDGGSQTTTVQVNQTQAPDDVTNDGSNWESLSVISVSGSGTLTVTLTDAGDGYAIADAIWIREVEAVSRIIDDEDPGHQFVGGWGQGNSTLCYGDDFWYNVAGSGQDKSIWTFADLPQGDYEVLATWPAHRNRATNAPYKLDGGNQSTTVSVNQTQAPDDVTNDGSSWESLSVVSVSSSGTLTVTLTDAGDGYAMADAIWIRQVERVSQIIDDEDPGHQFVGGWGQGNTPLCYGGDFWYNVAGSGQDKSIWTFAGLPEGGYEVLATWPAHPNRATNAPYTLDGGSQTTTVQVNQTQVPDDIISDRIGWESLSVITVSSSGTLTVTLTDAGNGYAMADAIWVRQTTAPVGVTVSAKSVESAEPELLSASLAGEQSAAVSSDSSAGAYPEEVMYFDLLHARSSEQDADDSREIDEEDSLADRLIRLGAWL